MKTTQGIFSRSAAAALCFIMILCSAACTSSKELMTEFKYSFNCTDWTDDEPFKDISEIPSNSGKIVYFNIENRESTPINYSLKLTMTEGTAGSAEFGYIVPVQAAYESLGSAVRDISESKPLDSGYVFSSTLEANKSVTVALVLYCAAGTVGAESKLSISYEAAAVS